MTATLEDPFRFVQCGPCRRGHHDRCRGRSCECECAGGAS